MKFIVQGTEYDAQQLNIGDLISKASAKVKNDLRAESLAIADELSGKERLQYLQGIPKSLPKGQELIQYTSEWFNEIDGIKWLISNAVGKDVNVNYGNLEYFTEMISYIMGSEVSMEQENTEQETTENFPKAVEELRPHC